MGKDFEPEIVVLYCRRSLAPGAEVPEESGRSSGYRARLRMMPCTSKVEVSHLVKILEAGAHGIEVVGCADGGCQFLGGSRLAQKRVEYARRFLEQLRLGPERLGMHRGEGMSARDILDLAEKRAEAVRSLEIKNK